VGDEGAEEVGVGMAWRRRSEGTTNTATKAAANAATVKATGGKK
jgi:hypothetical protein